MILNKEMDFTLGKDKCLYKTSITPCIDLGLKF